MMRMLLIVLCFILPIIFVVNGLSDDDYMWLDRIFGSYIHNSFAFPKSLEKAIDYTNIKISSSPDLAALGYVCSNYTAGAIAGKFRIHIPSIMSSI
jgi:hypothetical protein